MKNIFCLFVIAILILITGCSKVKDVFEDVKNTVVENVPDIASTIGEKTKEYTEIAVDKAKYIANDSIKRIDMNTEFIYSQPELGVVDVSSDETHIFSCKKDLFVTINITPNTKLLETAKELIKLSDKAIPVEIEVKLPKRFTVVSTGGTITDVVKKDDTVKFLLDVYNTKNKVYSIILKISGRSEGECSISIKYGNDSFDERDLESNIQQKIKFERR